MRNTELLGLISGALVFASAIPYAWNTYKGRIQPNLTSWCLWSFIGLTLLLAYKSSGAEDSVWPAVFGFTNPTLIAMLAIWRRGHREPMTRWEKASTFGCMLSLMLWVYVHDSKELSQYALCLGIVADICAAVPTIVFVWTQPQGDRPGPWAMYAFAYGLSIFAIEQQTFANYVLPVYMLFGALSVAFPLALYRVRAGVPLREWI